MRRLPLSLCVLGFFILVQTTISAQEKKTADTTVYTTKPVVVVAERALSAVSDATFRSRDLELLPKYSAQDLLRIVPGLVIAQHAGGGKAEQIFLRGFDADHGTDVNINVDGAPVNMVSHGHGQGYADLHFVIPELVERIDVVKGPYFAQYGDLTTAGAVTLHIADTVSQNIAKLEGGLYGLYRGLAIASTSFGSTKAYVGAELLASQGYFDAPQDLQRLNLIAKVYQPLTKDAAITASLMRFSSSWNASGQVPDRAVATGQINRFGAIDPNEGGNTSRTTFQVALDQRGLDPLNIKASVTDYRFQLFSNFTFFLNDSVNGDMIEQTDDRQVYSLSAQKSFSSTWGDIGAITQFGTNARHDNVSAALYHDSVRTRLSTTRNNHIAQTNVGVFAQQSIFVDRLSIVVGLRGDFFSFNVTDRTQQIDAVTGNVSTFLVSPKANLAFTIDDNATLFLNSGFGFHSNDARVAVTVPNSTTVPRAFGAELGSRWANELIAVSAAFWMLDLESEFVWIGDEGTTEESGRSRRTGIDLELRVQPLEWLTIGSNATFSRGRMRDLAVGEDLIPLAPNLTLTSYAVASTSWGTAALRMRHVGSRAANENNSTTASGYTILDLTASVPLSSSITVNLQCENLLNAQWREAQFDTQSRLRGEPTSVSEIHYTPGTPMTFRLGFALTF